MSDINNFIIEYLKYKDTETLLKLIGLNWFTHLLSLLVVTAWVKFNAVGQLHRHL